MTILAAVDLSPISLEAARAALRLARRLGDDLLLVRAIEPLAVDRAAGLSPEDEAMSASSMNALANLRIALGADDVPVELRVVAGRPHEAIAACARTTKARLIVMGTHGRGTAARLLLGSVTQATIAHSPCPVLAVREGSAPLEAWASGDRPLRILAGIDRGDAGRFIVAWLDQLRAAGPTDLTLVHEYWPAREYARLGRRGSRDLDVGDAEVVTVLERELRRDLGPAGERADVHLRVCPVRGPVSEQLGAAAEAEGADVLVLGRPHPAAGAEGEGSLAERLAERIRSTALATLAATRVPLLVVPLPARPQPPSAISAEVPGPQELHDLAGRAGRALIAVPTHAFRVAA